MAGTGDEGWRDTCILNRHRYLLKTGFMSDCTFSVGVPGNVTHFKCHKFLLGHSSKVFYLMLYLNNPDADEIRIEDVQPRHFQKLLEYIYTDEVELGDVQTAFSVCEAAETYQTKPLVQNCLEFLCSYLEAGYVCKLLEFVPAKSSQRTTTNCIQYLNHHTEAVLASESFLRIKLETLVTILKEPNLRVPSEVHLFSACLRWAQSNSKPGESLRKTLGLALEYIRFRTFTVEEFVLHVLPTKILTPLEEREIHCCIATNTGDMPAGLCNIVLPREFYGSHESLEIYHFNDPNTKGTIGTSGESDYWKISFSTDVDASVSGIRVWGARSDLNTPYNENIRCVLRQCSTVIASGVYRGQLTYGGFVNIPFKTAARIVAGLQYSLQLYYAEPNQTYKSYELISSRKVAKSGLKLSISESKFNHIAEIVIAKRVLMGNGKSVTFPRA